LTRDGPDKDSGGGIAIQTGALAQIEAVLFDLDGTLCYYPLSVEEVLGEALRRTRMAPDALGDLADAAVRYWRLWDEVQKTLESTERIRLRIMDRLLSERRPDQRHCAARLSEAYGAVRDASGIRAFDGVEVLLDELKGSYRLGLLTNGPSDIQWEKIRSLGFGDVFDAIVVAGDVAIYKPDAAVFDMLLDRLEVRASAALFVGDNYELDIVGAHRAGMRTVWIGRDGAGPAEDIVCELKLADATELREVLL
jgi:2-haloalkanoic acid dehalogenase type II